MKGRKTAFVYDESVSRHELREGHPMRPTRLQQTYELLVAYGAFAAVPPVPPRPATKEELCWFHSAEYVDAVASISRGEERYPPERFNLSEQGDNPPYKGMYEAACLATGGSLLAAQLVAEGKADVAFNISGGLHHAMARSASGFCVFNDPVVAIEYLRRRGLRVAYVDIDCHHGDGVQAAYYESNEVLTISLHESGRYLFPGTGAVEELGEGRGRGYSVNLPFAPYTGDAVFQEAFEGAVVPIVGAFAPEVIVAQLGIDTHFDDPLTHLQLTVEGHGKVVARILELAPRCVALGGGGYDMSAVARGWTLDYGLMMGKAWPEAIPLEYASRYGLKQLRDGAAPTQPREALERTRQFAAESVAQIRELVFPTHGLRR